MAEESTTTGAEETKDNLPPVGVEVEDLGSLRKKIRITVPAERIAAKRDESIKQLHNSAQVPGFRIGRAPRRLIEKRFGTELGQDVKASMVAAGYQAAVEQSKLKVLGEPTLDDEKFAAIIVPDEGPMTFDVEVEVQPEFELPALEGIAVTRPSDAVTDADVEQATQRWRDNFATTETVDEPAKADDVLTVNLTCEFEGADKHDHADANVAVRAQAIEGVPLENLGEKLTGAKPGDTVAVETTVPDGHPTETLRGKKVTFTFAVKHVKRVKLPDLDDAFAGRFGFENVAAFNVWLRERLATQSKTQQQQAMRQQVYDYLLGKVQIELPAGVLARTKDRTLARRANDLMMRGLPRTEIEKHIDELAVSAGAEAERDLKTLFIMQRVAEQLKVEVNEQEVNGLIAQMAAQYNRRPDSLREELSRRDGLGQLYLQIQEQKAIDQLLEKATVTDAPVAPPEDESAPKAKAKKKPKAEEKPE